MPRPFGLGNEGCQRLAVIDSGSVLGRLVRFANHILGFYEFSLHRLAFTYELSITDTRHCRPPVAA